MADFEYSEQRDYYADFASDARELVATEEFFDVMEENDGSV